MVGQEHEKSGDLLLRATGVAAVKGAATGRDAGGNGLAHGREPATTQRSRRDSSAQLNPARDNSEKYAWGRSDAIALASMLLLLVTVVARLHHPELARELALELRYLLGLLASCFMLGISGWFPAGERPSPKLDAVYTLIVLVVLVAMWDFLLSGALHLQLAGLIEKIAQLRVR